MRGLKNKRLHAALSVIITFCLTLGTVTAAGVTYEARYGKTAAAESYYKAPVDDPVVVLDPGHDSLHNGAHYGGMVEEILTLKIAQYCREALSDYAVTVCMTREGYSCPHPGGSNRDDNAKRARYAASVGADLMVDFHLNADAAGRYSGAEIYYPNANWKPALSVKGRAASEKIMAELMKLGIENNGIMIRNSTKAEYYPDGSLSDYYGLTVVPKYLDIPAIIVEHCYISSAFDRAAFLSSEEKLKALGEADARGIIAYLGLEKKQLVGTFDAAYYYENHPDLQTAIGDDPERLRAHFLTYGLSEGRCASPVFDVNFYREKNPDLAAAYGGDAVALAWHFERVGMEEGRRGSRLFDVYYYRLHEPTLCSAFGGDLKAYYLYFMRQGYASGQKATPETDTDAEGNPGHYAVYPKSESQAERLMYRVYDPRTGEHHYTAATEECEAVLARGWLYEGVAWTAPERTLLPVYRLFNPYSGEHHYTTDAAERAALLGLSWENEGIGWYCGDPAGTPVYRLYNPAVNGPGAHHYTVSVHERDVLSGSGWIYEGIAWYGLSEEAEDLTAEDAKKEEPAAEEESEEDAASEMADE